MTRTCAKCPAELGLRNRSGLCRACLAHRMNADPVVIANRAAGTRKHHLRPEVIAASTARLAKYMANMPEEHRQRRRERGKANAARLVEAGRNLSPQTRAENGRKRSETALSWCPPEWRAHYRRLTSRGIRAAEARRRVLDLIAGIPEPGKYLQQKAKLAWLPDEWRKRYGYLRTRYGAAEARARVEAEIAAAARARLAAMTPFERQLERVRNGAKLVEKLVFRSADPAYTLGGVATGML